MSAVITGDQNGTVGLINAGTAVASTSGTSIDFTGIPAGVKRITVMFNGVSLSGTSSFLIQLGTGGSPTTTGYVSATSFAGVSGSTTGGLTSTAGFISQAGDATYVLRGSLIFSNLSGNTWVCQGVTVNIPTYAFTAQSGGSVTLGGVLNMVRITTTNGTDTFDAGSINILYE